MIPAPFAYHRPRSLPEAVGLLSEHGDEARVIAGGHSLVPMMKLRLARPAHLVDLKDLGELRGIAGDGGSLVIGAMTTTHELVASELLAARCPILSEAALEIADPQVRYCGTLGGNLANGDPGNDMPAVMLALGAAYQMTGPDGERQVAARDFYRGIYTTALADGEILTRIHIPLPATGHGWAYEKQKRKVGDYATAAAAVLLGLADGACRAAAIALTNLGDTPLFAAAAGDALVGSPIDEPAVAEAVRRARAIARPAADGRGPVEFRVHVAGIMVRRAIARAKGRAR